MYCCCCWRSAKDSQHTYWKILPSVPQNLCYQSQRTPPFWWGASWSTAGHHHTQHRLTAWPALLSGGHTPQEEQQCLSNTWPQLQVHPCDLENNTFQPKPVQTTESARSLSTGGTGLMSLHALQEELQLSGLFVALLAASSFSGFWCFQISGPGSIRYTQDVLLDGILLS